MIRAPVMCPEQKGKIMVTTQMTIKIAEGGDFLRYGALKPFWNAQLEATQAIFMQFRNALKIIKYGSQMIIDHWKENLEQND